MENMLRDIDPPATSCITIPYFDVLQDYHRQEKLGTCFSYASCSPGLWDNLVGGVPGLLAASEPTVNSRARRRFAETYEREGVPISGRPLQGLRDDDGAQGIVRADLFRVPIPKQAAYDDIIELTIKSKTYDDYTRGIQRGIHDFVHDTIGGFMPSYASAIDVVFMHWHSTIDWLQSVWLACHVADEMVSQQDRQTSLYAFGTCVPRVMMNHMGSTEGGPFQRGPTVDHEEQPKATDSMIMQKRVVDTRANQSDFFMPIWDDPLIGKYFRAEWDDSNTEALGLQFWEVVDARALGRHDSFTYEMNTDSLLWKNLLSAQCPTASNDTVRHRAFIVQPPTRRHTNTTGNVYSYIESLIEQWVSRAKDLMTIRNHSEDSFSAKEPLHRLQYLSCCILHSNGSVVGNQLPRDNFTFTTTPTDRTWRVENGDFWSDYVHRREIVRDCPTRCQYLWLLASSESSHETLTSGASFWYSEIPIIMSVFLVLANLLFH